MAKNNTKILYLANFALIALLVVVNFIFFMLISMSEGQEVLNKANALQGSGKIMNFMDVLGVLVFMINLIIFKKYKIKKWFLKAFGILILYFIVFNASHYFAMNLFNY